MSQLCFYRSVTGIAAIAALAAAMASAAAVPLPNPAPARTPPNLGHAVATSVPTSGNAATDPAVTTDTAPPSNDGVMSGSSLFMADVLIGEKLKDLISQRLD